MHRKICSIIVTYNRKNELLKNIKALKKQTIKTDILVFDNASTDNTKEFLNENRMMTNDLIYYKSDMNLGGAGGFSRALKMAYNKKYDFFWLMDDDGFPINSFTLENCIKNIKNEKEFKIINSIVLCSKNRLSFSLQGVKSVDELNNIVDNQIVGEVNPFNGTLITKNVIEKIGFPRENFFIKGDETEYVLRAKLAGVYIATAIDSMYYHPELKVSNINIFGKKLVITEESYWKEYYRARNYAYISRKYNGLLGSLKYIIFTLIKIAYFKEDKKRKTKYVLKGMRDGFSNKFYSIKKL